MIESKTSQYMNDTSNDKKLSHRELQVLLLLAYEHTNKEMSKKLYISPGTIATYRNNILSKLPAKNSAGIIRIAFEKEILVLNKKNKIVLAPKFNFEGLEEITIGLN